MKLKIRITFGVLNYLTSIVQMAIPFVFPDELHVSAQVALILSGTFIMVASLLSNYELGVLKLISFREHLMVAIVVGLFLTFSPFVLGFYEQGFLLHTLSGLTIGGFASYIYKSTFIRQRPRLQYSIR